MLSLSRCRLVAILFLFVVDPSYGQQPHSACHNMLYDDHNQVDYTVRVNSVAGVAKDTQGSEVRGACAGIFTENDKTLMVAQETNVDGHFEIDGLPNGRYRLVVSANPLCAANAVIILKNKARRGKKLIAVMKPRGIDDCSSIQLR